MVIVLGLKVSPTAPTVAAITGVLVGVLVTVLVGVMVGVLVMVLVGVMVGVLVIVFVGVAVGVFVGVLVGVGVSDSTVVLGVNVTVFVNTGVAVGAGLLVVGLPLLPHACTKRLKTNRDTIKNIIFIVHLLKINCSTHLH